MGIYPHRLLSTAVKKINIDVAIASLDLALDCTWQVIENSMGSDRNPILITFNRSDMTLRHHVPNWKLEKADWTAFKSNCMPLTMNIDLEHSDTELFNAIVTEAKRAAATDSIPSTCNGKTRAKPLEFWNDDIIKSIRARYRSQNKIRKTKNIDDYRIQTMHRQPGAPYTRRVRNTGEYCTTLNHTTRLSTVWNMAKRMNGTTCMQPRNCLHRRKRNDAGKRQSESWRVCQKLCRDHAAAPQTIHQCCKNTETVSRKIKSHCLQTMHRKHKCQIFDAWDEFYSTSGSKEHDPGRRSVCVWNAYHQLPKRYC